MILLNYQVRIKQSNCSQNDQTKVAANAKVKNYKETPEGIYLIDYRTTTI